MCVVSMLSDWGHRQWPSYPPILPSYVPTYIGPSREEWEEFKELLKKATKFDEVSGQPDCVDPKKQEWMKEIEERLKKLEGR